MYKFGQGCELINVFLGLDDYKFRGAISKYGSNSQHKRLATMDHVQKGVLKMAKTILKGWSGHYS